jgi:hypothetical protein
VRSKCYALWIRLSGFESLPPSSSLVNYSFKTSYGFKKALGVYKIANIDIQRLLSLSTHARSTGKRPQSYIYSFPLRDQEARFPAGIGFDKRLLRHGVSMKSA